jgi:hypothetical protein
MFGQWDTPAMRRNAVRSLGEICLGLLLCYGLKVATKPYVAVLPNGFVRDVLALAPLLGILVIAAAGVRSLLRMDEYGRRQLVEGFAAAGGVTMVLALAYAMLEDAGWPRLSMVSVCFMMSIAWVVCSLASVWLRHR